MISVPTGVIINKLGNLKAIFSKSNTTYDIPADDIKDAMATCKLVAKKIIAPTPPSLEHAGSNILSLKWEFIFPPGLSQQVELQYLSSKLFSPIRSGHSDSTDIPKQPKKPKESQWQLLVTRSWSLENFDSYTFHDLLPGVGFYFRIRIYSHEGWSPYSEISELFKTVASRPSQPGPPFIAVSMPSCLQLRWTRANSNGSPIKGYLLRAKLIGNEQENQYDEIYKGPLTSHLAMGLKSESQYSFEVAAENDIGLSEYSLISLGMTSTLRSISYCTNTPQSLAAMNCKAAWSECWDLKAEEYFYFNSLTGIKQTEKPEILHEIIADSIENGIEKNGDSTESKSTGKIIEEIDPKKEADITFRRKRYRLLKNVHQYTALLRKKIHNLPPKSGSELFAVELRRSHLLIDGYRAISRAQPLSVCNRMKVTFHGTV